MTDPGQRLPRLTLILDANAYISAALSPRGQAAQILAAAVRGEVVLVASPLLLAEVREVLARDKFRRWLSEAAVDDFLSAIELLAHHRDDPAPLAGEPLCRDPDDDYLLLLAAGDEDVNFLVSGDKDLLTANYAHVKVRTPREITELLATEHEWGAAFVTGRSEEALRQIATEGHEEVIYAAATFMNLAGDADFDQLLPELVTPESLPLWLEDGAIAQIREMLNGRGMASRPDYPAPDVAYVRLPPSPEESTMVTRHVMLPAIILTLQKRPELPVSDLGRELKLRGWRVHAIGDYFPVVDLPQARS